MAARGYTPEQFLDKARDVWGDRWDYSKTEYVKSRRPLTITCSLHGDFYQEAASHLKRYVGCKPCADEANRAANPIQPENFFARARERWGDRWDYTNSVYLGATKKVGVVCPIHGEFFQKASSHLEGVMGCMGCRNYKPRPSTSEFIAKAQALWGDRWNYSTVVYESSKVKVSIVCPEHGEFLQSPMAHLQGTVGCPSCHGQRITTSEFIGRSRSKWGDRWSYDEVEYINSHKGVTITCRDHGAFSQAPIHHLHGWVGCRSCSMRGTSAKEAGLATFIKEQGMHIEQHSKIPGSRKEMDIFIRHLGIAFEFNGLFWHSENYLPKNYHRDKYLECTRAGIRLYQIWEDDWDLRPDIVKAHITRVLGTYSGDRVYARQTRAVKIDVITAREFLNQNHLQGFTAASEYWGLIHGEDVVAVATFKRNGATYTLSRYATSISVVGGHSKLIKAFENTHPGGRLITFADITFGVGDLYTTTGWSKDKVIPPDYYYIVDGRRVHKFNYRLTRFKEDPDLEYVAGKSEREMAALNNLPRIWDAGKIRFVK